MKMMDCVEVIVEKDSYVKQKNRTAGPGSTGPALPAVRKRRAPCTASPRILMKWVHSPRRCRITK